MHAGGQGVREIAREIGVSAATVSRDIKSDPPAAPKEVENLKQGGEAGNLHGLVHGTRSERTLKPVRERHAAALQGRYPYADPGRIATQAQRLAMIELGAAWLDEQGEVVRDSEGRVFDIADRVDSWSKGAERWFERAADEQREKGRFDGLHDFMEGDNDGEVTQ